MEKSVTWFFLFWVSISLCYKILHYQYLGIVKRLCSIAVSACSVYVCLSLKEHLPYGRFVVVILAMSFYIKITTSTRFDLSLTGMIISVGISYGFFLAASLISSFIILTLALSTGISMLQVCLTILIQLVLVFLLFRIKRFKKGMLFLKDKNAGFVGIIIGAIIFITCVLIGGNHLSLWGGTVLIIGASISIIALIIWWRRSLTKLYQKWIRERNMQEYEALITEKDQQIQRLKESNESMANLIHRDNKLLPALYDAVKVLLHSTRKIADAELKLSSRNLMNQIEQIMDERAEIMHKYQRENKTLPSTNDALIDGVMAHMLHRTCENNIQFDLSAPDDISELTEIIPSIKLEMLCADLIENAIIAAMHSEHKKILVILGMSDGYYEINVQDSGIPFESATLLKLGRQKASTHLDEGGSGIGYMTIFEILREYRASLEITEYEQPRMGFTKSIRVRFDNNNQFVVLQSNKMIRLHG